jgi:hypothetical protein
VIVYLSYSGLDSAIEAGIRHEQIVANFPLLASAGIPIVHYWRPAFPVSATTETMTRVLDLAARYAACTMAAGLKVEAGALDRLSRHWPELAATPGATTAECVYPAAFWDFIHRAGDLHPGYPVFHTNSCALACVLGEADRFGVYGNHGRPGGDYREAGGRQASSDRRPEGGEQAGQPRERCASTDLRT